MRIFRSNLTQKPALLAGFRVIYDD